MKSIILRKEQLRELSICDDQNQRDCMSVRAREEEKD
jgi:hypothetical protein